jgi:hypothetical protein
MKPQNEPPITDLDGLMALFDFDAHDLAENHAGRMSPRQRERAEAQTLTASIEKTATTISLPVIPLVTLPYLILVTRYGDEWGAGVLLAIVVWFAIMALCFWLVYRGVKAWLNRTARDRSHWLLRRLGRLDRRIDASLRAGKVLSLAGVISFPDDGEHTYIYLGETEFTNSVAAELDERLWRLAAGRAYTLYYVPEVLWVMGVEAR